MHCIAIADLHGNLPHIEECDFLVIAGDICPHRFAPGSPMDMTFQAEWLDAEFRQWLQEVPARHILAVAGNHDFVFERMPEAIPDLPWILLEDREVEVDGLRVFGTPRQLPYCDWAFNTSDEQLATIFATVSSDLDLLISHGPPYGCGDRTFSTMLHTGSRELRKLITTRQPAFVVTGHMHEGYGMYRIADEPKTCVINASLVNWQNRIIHDPVPFEL